MSKQVKLKFKKSLKKAEFVHADLEYHEELISEAKREFFAKVEEIFNKLSPEDKKKINEVKKKKMTELLKKQKLDEAQEEKEIEDLEGLPEKEEMLSTDEESETESEEEDAQRTPAVKSSDLKNLFHSIADICHPDKTSARGLAEHEIKKLELVFKEAQTAYTDDNWYLLYVIALDLGIDIEDPTKNHIEWVEEDIQRTLEKISKIGTLVVWVWYNGDGFTKLMAMQNYFRQSFGYNLRI
jgi:hypothetical protein